MQPRGSAAEHCRGRRGVPSLSGAAEKRDGAVGAANARRGSRSARFRCAPLGGRLGGSSAPPSRFRRGLDVLQGKTASRGALGRRASTMGVLPLTPPGTGKANSRPILLSRLRCLSVPASRRCSAVVAEWGAPGLGSAKCPHCPGGAAPRARGFLSGRRQRHSGGGHGGGLWGPLSARHRSIPFCWRQGDCGTVGWREHQSHQVRRLRGAAPLPRAADIFPAPAPNLGRHQR